MLIHLPNFLTLLRIVAIPIFLILLTGGRPGGALLVFLLVGVTDAADGAIARLTNSRTTLGAYMDPLADKMLVLSSFVALAFMELVPRWLTVVVISRDVIILAGYVMLFFLTERMMEIRPSVLSKLTTFCHLLTLSSVLLVLYRPNAISTSALGPLFLVTGIVTAASGVHYMGRGLRWYQRVTGTP